MDWSILEVDWKMLAGALALLLLPGSLLYPAGEKDRLAHLQKSRFRVERMFGAWQHWVDFGRGLAGTYLLAAAASVPEWLEPERYQHQDLILIAGALAAAVALQTVHYRRDFYFTAPIFFLWGVILVLVPWLPALFAIFFSTLMARLADHVELKLAILAVLLGVTGYLVGGLSLWLLLASMLTIFPILIAFASRHQLVCYTPHPAAR